MKNLYTLIMIISCFFILSAEAKSKKKKNPKNNPKKETKVSVVQDNISVATESALQLRAVEPIAKNDQVSFRVFGFKGRKPRNIYYQIKNASLLETVRDGSLAKDTALMTSSGVVTITTKNLTPGQYRLYVFAREYQGDMLKAYAEKNDYGKFIIDDSRNLSDPGDSAKNSIGGVDSDKDGIRDDIQIWINEHFGHRPNYKEALKQYARSEQNLLLKSYNETLAVMYLEKSSLSMACLDWVNKTDDDSVKKIYTMTRNTESRTQAASMANAYRKSQPIPDYLLKTEIKDWDQFCDFNAMKEL